MGSPESRRGLPRWAGLLLAFLLPAELREPLAGDLEERVRGIRARAGRVAAHRWLVGQLVRLRPWALRTAIREARAVGRSHETGGGGMGGGGWGIDLRQAGRALRVRPAASLMVVATVALAVGATTAVFSVVRGVLLEPLPFPEPERLVRIWQTRPAWADAPNAQLRAFADRFPLSVPTFQDWSAANLGFEAIGVYAGRDMVLDDPGGATVLEAQIVTAGFFDALGVAPIVGRALTPEDDRVGAERVVVIDAGFWTDRFGADPAALGATLVLDGTAHTIVGVMPPGFGLPDEAAALWTPLREHEKTDHRDSQFLTGLARLAPGTTEAAALERLLALQARLSEEYPDAQEGLGARVQGLLDSVVGEVRTTLWFLLGAVGLVLMVAALNIANILAVLGLGRARELAVRAALGAGAARLVRGRLLESALLAGAGGVAGIGIAWAALPLLVRLVPPNLPRVDAVGMDPLVVAFGLAVTAATAVLVGVLPAWQAARAEPHTMMRAAGRSSTGDRAGDRIRSALVMVEVGLAFVLLVGATLLGTSYLTLWSQERGFETEGLLLVSAFPDPAVYPEREDRDRFQAEVRERMRAIPGGSVTAASQVPLGYGWSSSSFEVDRAEREPEEISAVLLSVVLDDYFEVMGIPILEGRGFAPSDARDTPLVGIVNEALARRVWPGESPLGQRLRDDAEDPWVTVVGVARNVRHVRLEEEVDPKLYLPASQTGRYAGIWVLRARGDLAAVTDLARSAIRAVSPSTPVRGVEVLQERIARSVAVPRFRTLLVVGLAGMAGVLALLGVYGVVGFAVAQRTREIGVRMALGARADGVVREVVGGGLRLVLGGVALGMVVALGVADVLTDFLFRIEPTEPGAYAAIAVALLLIGCAAAYLPARRAASVDPVRVLGVE